MELTEAELAEIREAAEPAAPVAADDPDPAGVAAALTAQAAAASARRRGPGQPGSMRHVARESSSRAAAFGTGLPLDVMPACPDLALLADQAADEDDSYAGASDDELIGVLCAWDRVKQHPRWKVDQLPDGTFRWTTPSGRTYDTEPTRYPV